MNLYIPPHAHAAVKSDFGITEIRAGSFVPVTGREDGDLAPIFRFQVSEVQELIEPETSDELLADLQLLARIRRATPLGHRAPTSHDTSVFLGEAPPHL